MKEFIFLHISEFIVLSVAFGILINLALRYKWTIKTVNSIIDDTLKVSDGRLRRFSGTKITMMVAFGSVLWAFHYITIKNGFNETAFITMACIATGVAVTGAWSKKIDPTIVSPDSQMIISEEKNGEQKTTIIESNNEKPA